jgi:hypothetical protein
MLKHPAQSQNFFRFAAILLKSSKITVNYRLKQNISLAVKTPICLISSTGIQETSMIYSCLVHCQIIDLYFRRIGVMKKLCVILCCFTAVFCVTSCGSKKDGPVEKTNIVFWYSNGGIIGETIVNLTKQFNTAHENITVEPQFQGSYDEAINKLKTAMRTKSGPDLIQIYEGGTRFMVDSGFISGVLLGLLAQNRTKKGSLFRILCALPMAVSSACASIISEPV